MERLPFVNHLLQHTLRSLCGDYGSNNTPPSTWVYSIFWRILPRNYPPPIWDSEAGPYDRSKGNKRNWILVWEDGYCDFDACSREQLFRKESKKAEEKAKAKEEEEEEEEGEEEDRQEYNGPLQPELFFKMSHDVYNYGEGLMGKIAAEKSHRWIFRDPTEHKNVPLLSAWQASADSYPRTWEAQFKAGIKTIAIIAVGEGLLQLGSTKKVPQDVDFVLMLQRTFRDLQSIPGVFAQTKITRSMNGEGDVKARRNPNMKQLSGFKQLAQPDNNEDDEACNSSYPMMPLNLAAPPNPAVDIPSMYNSLQALLSKLPAVTPNIPMVVANPSHQSTAGALSQRMRSPPSMTSLMDGNSLVTGHLLPMMEAWPDSHQAHLMHPQPPPPPPSLPLSSSNPAIPSLSEEFENYNSFFGQLIS